MSVETFRREVCKRLPKLHLSPDAIQRPALKFSSPMVKGWPVYAHVATETKENPFPKLPLTAFACFRMNPEVKHSLEN